MGVFWHTLCIVLSAVLFGVLFHRHRLIVVVRLSWRLFLSKKPAKHYFSTSIFYLTTCYNTCFIFILIFTSLSLKFPRCPKFSSRTDPVSHEQLPCFLTCCINAVGCLEGKLWSDCVKNSTLVAPVHIFKKILGQCFIAAFLSTLSINRFAIMFKGKGHVIEEQQCMESCLVNLMLM